MAKQAVDDDTVLDYLELEKVARFLLAYAVSYAITVAVMLKLLGVY